ncbi:MAG: two-component regulator propeller domain-containing protein [Bacteroidales bacterium]
MSLIEAPDKDENKKKFINFTNKDGLSGDFVRNILQDKQGRLWFATDKGVFRYDHGESKIFTDVFKVAGLASQFVQTMAEDREGHLWFGTNKGVIRYDPSGEENPQRLTALNGLAGDDVRCMMADVSGNMWFGTGTGVSEYNQKDNAFMNLTTEQGLPHNIVCSITEDETGSLWFGTLGGGLCRYDGKSIVAYTKKQGLPLTVVYAITEDHLGNLWFGGNDAGITKYTRTNFRITGNSFTNFNTAQGLYENYILAMLTDRDGNLWMGSPTNLQKFDGKAIYNYTTEQGMVNNYVVSILEDHSGNLWIGTYEGGISRFDGKSFSNFTTANGLVHNTVWGAFEDRNGNIWFATRSGLSIYTGDTFINFTTEQGLPDNKLSSVIGDQLGNILIGTWGSGIAVIRKNKVDDILKNKKTESGGSVFENFSTSDGLSNNVVYNILEDSAGNIFIGTNEGITVLRDGLDPTGKNLAKSGLENFNQKSGYPIKDISNNNSMFLDSRGIIWAGTGDKLVRFDYNKLHNSTKAPGIIIRDVKVNHENISWYSLQKEKGHDSVINSGITSYHNHEQLIYGKILSESVRDTLRERFSSIRFDSLTPFYGVPLNLVLPYAFNSISFDFVGVETRRPFLVKYQYKLEGYDDEWSPASTESTANFGNLPFGQYTFLLKARSPDGVWIEPARYQFEILPPWYLTWPAFIFYGI